MTIMKTASFSGTTTDPQLTLEGLSLFDWTELPDSNASVNGYFWRAHQALWAADDGDVENGLGAVLQELSRNYPNYALWVSGHSLGGALASLGGLLAVRSTRWTDVTSVNYNFGYAKALKTRNPNFSLS